MLLRSRKKDLFHGAASNSYWCIPERNSAIAVSMQSFKEQVKLV